MAAMADFVEEHLGPRRGQKLRILDVGSMDVNGSYRAFFDDPAWAYTGLDLAEGPGVDVVVDQPYRWRDLADGSFDVVVSGQAFEHFEYPWVSMLEVARVLRPGGLVCVIVPSGGYEHRYPLDCWRYYPDGIAALARWADLDVVSAETNWEPKGDYTDDSAEWKDTVLVARKPAGNPSLATRAKTGLLRRVNAFQAARRSGVPSHP
jgi:SAM-dependent methyltransferase